MVYIYIGAGGFLGSICRYAIGKLADNGWSGSFPAGTLIVNLAGCFLLGFLMTLSLERLVIHPDVRLGITSGFLGGLTTFSTYNHEALALFYQGLWGTAALYVALSILAGLVAVWLGMAAAKVIPSSLRGKSRRG